MRYIHQILHMKKILFGLIIFSISMIGYAEKIDGPANIRQKPNGAVIFSLHDNSDVECTEFERDWYEIMVTIKLTKKEYETNPLIFKKGTQFFDMQNNEIGVTLTDLKVGSKITAGGAQGIPKWYAASLYGYTFKTNIKPQSIIEPVLSQLIESNVSHLTLATFKEHLKEFHYMDGLKIPGYDKLVTYMVYENSIDDPSPLDRIRLVFEDNQLIAIIHSRALMITGYETYEIARGRKLTLIKKFENVQKADFIQKNSEAYTGVD